jgi:hypothetical protein
MLPVASESAVGTVQLGFERDGDLLLIGYRGLRFLHALHVAFAIRTRAEVHLVNSARHGFLGARRKPIGVDIFAQQFGETDDGKIDVAAGRQRDARKFNRSFVIDGAAF